MSKSFRVKYRYLDFYIDKHDYII